MTISTPPHFSGQILRVSQVSVSNYTTLTPYTGDIGAAWYNDLEFCNITVTYTHPDQNDSVNVEIWLPPPESWNGDFQGQGGGGWFTGLPNLSHPQSISQGFAVASTDGGHYQGRTPLDWGMRSPGHVAMHLLKDFASVALHDMTLLAKEVVESYYGTKAKHSYWHGCSTGGRQGLMLAQKYPTDYDGILALAPAINWDRLLVATFWPQLVMQQYGVFPPGCEFEAIRQKAVEACDGLDGVVDGVVAAPGLCQFDPMTLIGQPFLCDKVQLSFTEDAAKMAKLMWRGPQITAGRFMWYGLTPDASFAALGGTSCSKWNVTSCLPSPFSMATEWLQVFLAKDTNLDTSTITPTEYETFFYDSIDQYASIIGTSNPDLSAFRAAGGKMITWHGLSDSIIFPNGSSNYYERVLEQDPHARDFYRYFEAPGVGHCNPLAGIGAYPVNVMADIVKWVEQDEAPEVLNATGGEGKTRNICLYPLVSKYIGGDQTLAESYVCAETF
ncbi:hypothetical protein BP5796_01923 [Coleophoma crateriformis]|uniref:Carboxylic ester hydrolase n=1 Tax=Coleophoma crateriformis TaxID=565419 RepID=A0A3D8T202_9HELO|nr:hypothetical protein BP5796_01923 [Coleophoma crateriformis]